MLVSINALHCSFDHNGYYSSNTTSKQGALYQIITAVIFSMSNSTRKDNAFNVTEKDYFLVYCEGGKNYLTQLCCDMNIGECEEVSSNLTMINDNKVRERAQKLCSNIKKQDSKREQINYNNNKNTFSNKNRKAGRKR